MLELAPILNGAPGFILLGFVVALGAYMRTVAVSAQDTYDKIISQTADKPDPLWPRDAAYTEGRLKNLKYVYWWLKQVTYWMFLFVCVVAARLFFLGLFALPGFGNAKYVIWFYAADLIIVSFLVVAFIFMWWIHHVTARQEEGYVDAMRDAVERKRAA